MFVIFMKAKTIYKTKSIIRWRNHIILQQPDPLSILLFFLDIISDDGWGVSRIDY